MLEIDLNLQFANLLRHYNIRGEVKDEFIHTDLLDNLKFRARAVYQKVNESFSSRLDVNAITDKGENIYESCGDYGATIEEAVYNNFKNFSMSSLHPLLAVFGCCDPHTFEQITIEEWTINGRIWKAYIGNLVPKVLAFGNNSIVPPRQFFNSFEDGIKSQKLKNRIHWFRGYYSQMNNEIIAREFLMDNELLPETDLLFKSLPLISNVSYYSCRNFVILKDNGAN